MRITVYREDGGVLRLDGVRHVKMEFVTRWPFLLKICEVWHLHGYKKA